MARDSPGGIVRPAEKLIETRDIVQRSLDGHLASADVAEHVATIVAARRYEEAWEIKAQTPDLASLGAFASVARRSLDETARLTTAAKEAPRGFVNALPTSPRSWRCLDDAFDDAAALRAASRRVRADARALRLRAKWEAAKARRAVVGARLSWRYRGA